ncbi:AAA family ATPase [Clostridium intestinale]|uniref:AAA family ATPase n=1 Tax=Clostridium intestinale TaxID=36845 RepID=A0A7D7A5B2_9CLOT|nr:AAA family ATPase [Clostridium intestinale]QLY81238.1 AAA family ATPase [Clostridium intestinale]
MKGRKVLMDIIEKSKNLSKQNNVIELCYVWIDKYKLIHKQGFNFSSEYYFEYEEQNNLLECKLKSNYIKNFFGNNILGITAIVGKNGSGKSLLMQYLSNNLFSIGEKKIVIYRKEDEFHIIYSGMNKPIIKMQGYTTFYYEWDKYYEDSSKELEKKLGVLNSIFYSNLFYDSIEIASKDLNSLSVNISTSSLMRSKKNNSHIYRNDGIAQVDKFLGYDNLLLIQFILHKKDFVDTFIKPSIRYLQIDIINNYFKEGNEKYEEFLNTYTFFIEEFIDSNNISVFKEIKERDREFRDALFEKLIVLNNNIKNQKNFFELNTIINLIYDFYCSIYKSINENKEINQELYKKLYKWTDFNVDSIKGISIENIKYKVLDCLYTIDFCYNQIEEELKSDLGSKIEEYEEQSNNIINEIKENIQIYFSKDFLNLKEAKSIIKDVFTQVNRKLKSKEYFNPVIIRDSIERCIEDNSYTTINENNIITLLEEILKYYFNRNIKYLKEKIDKKLQVVQKRKYEIVRYIEFIYVLDSLDSSWIVLKNSERLIIELNKHNINILNRFIKHYYGINFWGYYNFRWLNGLEEDRRILSSGEESMIKMYSRFYSIFRDIDNDGFVKINKKNKSILILMDEPEIYLHPEWQVKLISNLIEYFNEVYKGYNVQLIITSNTPFLISDLPSDNVILLEKVKLMDSKNFQVKICENTLSKTFGQNIHTLLKKSFFMETTFGEFSRKKIKEVIEVLNSNEKMTENKRNDIEKIINILGEPLIKNKLLEMFNSKLDIKSQIKKKEEQIELYKKEVEELKKRMGSLND